MQMPPGTCMLIAHNEHHFTHTTVWLGASLVVQIKLQESLAQGIRVTGEAQGCGLESKGRVVGS